MGFFADLLSIDSLIVFNCALFAHFLTDNIFIPFLTNPNRFYASSMGLNSSPWLPLSPIKNVILTVVVLFLFLKYVTNLALQLYTLRKCNKKNYKLAKKPSNIPAIFGLVIYGFIYAVPMFKVPMLMYKQYIPFIQNFLYGIPMAFAVSFGYYMQKIGHKNNVCR